MRIHFMDAMRSILMMLGVVLHAANVYSVNVEWEVNDPNATHPFFDVLSACIHSFRMPAFFIVAGFFAQLTYVRYGTRQFLAVRGQRLLLPLVSTLPIVNTLQMWLVRPPGQSLVSGPDSFLLSTLPQDWLQGHAVQHLWFLCILLIYCFLCLPVAAVLRRLPASQGPSSSHTKQLHLCAVILGPIFCVGMVVLQHTFPVLYGGPYLFGMFNPALLLTYLPYFIYGMWLHRDQRGLMEFSKFSPMTLWSLAMLLALKAVVRNSSHGSFDKILDIYQAGMLQWFGCHVCFGFFRLCCNAPSRLFKYLAEASYTVYLTHHLVIVAMAGLLLSWEASAFAKFSIVTALSLTVTLSVHEFMVKRVGLFGLLFNGRPLFAKAS